MWLLRSFVLAAAFSCTCPAHPTACTSRAKLCCCFSLAFLISLLLSYRQSCTSLAAKPGIRHQARKQNGAHHLPRLRP